MTTPTATACLRCGTLGGYIPRPCTVPTRPRGLCQKCYDHENNHGDVAQWPLSDHYAAHPKLPTGRVTLASRGIRGDRPPIDPALTPAMVRAVANLNARAAFVWLVARGMDAERARHLATWQPAEASTPGDAERRAA